MFRRITALLVFIVSAVAASAQFNTDRLIQIGRSALYYEDYVLSIQYFNQAINAKPYLYEPWYFRAIGKYYLDDFAGAEADCTEAMSRNPYVVGVYELRGLTRIQQDKFAEAVEDYTKALRFAPDNQNMWHNRVLCRIQQKDYAAAHADLDTMLTKWSHYARGYAMRADVFVQQKDTANAEKALEKSCEIDPYNAQTWTARAYISLGQRKWKDADEYLGKAIHLNPKQPVNYINRALARVNMNKLRGAMADYDMALDVDPNNFLAHYNRGLLRAQVGDDNRAITDFDFVLKLEPDNIMALYNRALLLDNTGNLRGAIRDYSKVINEFPNFWAGLQARARCYRRLGMTRQAEADEFRVYKAQLYKHLYGRQPRLNKEQLRKRSDIDPDKYNQLTVADEQETHTEYSNEYRGKVQNRKVAVEFMPMYELSFEEQKSDGVRDYTSYSRAVDEFNHQDRPLKNLNIYIRCDGASLDEAKTRHYFNTIDTLSAGIQHARTMREAMPQLLCRAITYSVIQNFEAAVEDLYNYIQIDSTSALAFWQRAVCQQRMNRFNASQGTDVGMKTANVLSDLSEAIALEPSSPYLYYNRANVYVERIDYQHALADYNKALELDPNLAEAYYNRGLTLARLKRVEEAVADLSKAGELGIYKAYSMIKTVQAEGRKGK